MPSASGFLVGEDGAEHKEKAMCATEQDGAAVEHVCGWPSSTLPKWCDSCLSRMARKHGEACAEVVSKNECERCAEKEKAEGNV